MQEYLANEPSLPEELAGTANTLWAKAHQGARPPSATLGQMRGNRNVIGDVLAHCVTVLNDPIREQMTCEVIRETAASR